MKVISNVNGIRIIKAFEVNGLEQLQAFGLLLNDLRIGWESNNSMNAEGAVTSVLKYNHEQYLERTVALREVIQ